MKYIWCFADSDVIGKIEKYKQKLELYRPIYAIIAVQYRTGNDTVLGLPTNMTNKEIFKSFLIDNGIKGELHQSKWVGFDICADELSKLAHEWIRCDAEETQDVVFNYTLFSIDMDDI